MTITNKEQEMLNYLEEVSNKEMISINEFDSLKGKIGEAIFSKENRIKELTESRDNWKRKHSELQSAYNIAMLEINKLRKKLGYDKK